MLRARGAGGLVSGWVGGEGRVKEMHLCFKCFSLSYTALKLKKKKKRERGFIQVSSLIIA